MSIKLNSRQFNRRAKLLCDLLRSTSLLVVTGNANDALPYQKSTALQTWLFGYEFTDTALFIKNNTFHILTSGKKADIIESISIDPSLSLSLLRKTKDESENTGLLNSLINLLPNSLSIFQKDKFSGKFYQQWESLFPFKSFELFDFDSEISLLWASKDEDEIKNLKLASKMSNQLMKNYFIEEVESILDQEKSITHDKFTNKIDAALQDPKMATRLGFPSDASIDFSEWCYTPIIQSGGNFDLKISAQSNDNLLHPGVIICSLGVRYKSYCSNISRTFLVDPEKQVESNYLFLVQLHEYIISVIKPAIALKDVYAKAVAYIQNKKPSLLEHFVKSLGFSMGLEFRESSFTINAKNTNIITSGMVLNLSTGFQNLINPETTDPKLQKYALLVSDTVHVTEQGANPLTSVNKSATEITYMFKDADTVIKNEKPIQKSPKKSAILNSKTRAEDKDHTESSELKRKAHQKQLALIKQQEGLSRFSGEQGVSPVEMIVFKKFESYKKETQLPKLVNQCRILVDRKSDSLILPIYGYAVPFHISTLKNITKSDEGDQTILRFNFVTPGQTAGKKETTPFQDALATFIRSMTYKSADNYRFSELFREINEFKKEMSKRELERKELADLVVQDRLIEVKGKRPVRLPEVYSRPVEGKKSVGDFEIHINGLRYVSQLRSDLKIDILFSNIKNIFFQPCDSELLVIIHIHLVNPIIIGKKKVKDVQIYREVSDQAFDETGNRKRRFNYGDEDELEQEQEERRHRSLLNKEFKDFSEKISEVSKLDVDVPFRNLGFSGVPFRQLVHLQPTTNGLVHLSDPPFLVVDLALVEIAHLERVQFGLKNFDMVLVYKDFTKPVTHINTIPMSELDTIKEWLNSMDISYNEGQVNLNWAQIMKTVNDDPASFFAEGGWSFLQPESEEDEGMEDSESEFEIEGSEQAVSDSSESEDSYGDSEDGSASGESGDSEGAEWSELEEEAERHDTKKRDAVDDVKVKSKKSKY